MEGIFKKHVSYLRDQTIREIMCELGPRSMKEHEAMLRLFAALLPRQGGQVGYPVGLIANYTCTAIVHMWAAECPDEATIGAFVKILQREEFKECHEVLLPKIKHQFRLP